MEIKNLINGYEFLSQNEKETIIKIATELTLNEKSVEIVKILIANKADYVSVVCGLLLTDFRQNNSVIDNIELPEIVVTLLNSIIKIENINIDNKEISTENIKNLLISMANDIRVIIIKLADIYVSALNIDALNKTEADNLHLLIKELYVPISARLGLSKLKSKLQDLNVKYNHPQEFDSITKNLDELIKNREEEIEKNKVILEDMLKSLNIEGKVYGRVKHISSIYNKLKDKSYNLTQLYDLLAVRVLVNTESQCYEVLSHITSIYKPIDGRFKDYIARPKPNGYKSIHTTVITDNNDPLEIQIRTFDMHEFAEYGVAAHFLYKEKKTKSTALDGKLSWVRKMLENTDFSTASDYLDELKSELYANEIFVQTPLGKVISLRENSTPIDFAYAVHSNIGNKCVGSKVNGKLVPLNSFLHNGDIVEIITNPNSKGPSRDWLKIVKTSQARSKLNAFFKKEMKEENIKRGKSILEATCRSKHVDFKALFRDEWLEELYDKWALKTVDDLYAAVGYGGLTSTQIINKLYNKLKQEQTVEEAQIKTLAKKKTNDKGISFDNGLDGLMIRFAKCCNPVPGDEIVGFVSHGRGVTIHAKDCKNVQNFSKERIMNAYFTDVQNKKFNAKITVLAKKSNSVIVNVTKLITEEKIALTGVNVNNIDSSVVLYIYVDVTNVDELNNLMLKLERVKDVIEVKREKGE